jgi:hypothetical protein
MACGFVFFRFAAAGVEFRQQSGRGRFTGQESPAQLRAAAQSVPSDIQLLFLSRTTDTVANKCKLPKPSADTDCPSDTYISGSPGFKVKLQASFLSCEFELCLTPRAIVFYKHDTIHRLLILNSSYWLCLQPAFTLVSCSAYNSTLKMEATCSSETSVDIQRTTWRYIPEYSTLQLVLSIKKSCTKKSGQYVLGPCIPLLGNYEL